MQDITRNLIGKHVDPTVLSHLRAIPLLNHRAAICMSQKRVDEHAHYYCTMQLRHQVYMAMAEYETSHVMFGHVCVTGCKDAFG